MLQDLLLVDVADADDGIGTVFSPVLVQSVLRGADLSAGGGRTHSSADVARHRGIGR